MAKNTLYDFDPVNPFAVVREQYTNVGTGRNILGDIKRGFPGGTEFEIWDAAALGNQLVEDVDYELLTIDRLKSREAGYDIYTEYRILNPAYQAGNIYITYKIVHSYVSAETINDLIADVAAMLSLYPGEIIEWNLNDDPAIFGIPCILLEGNVILIANYTALVANTYVGDVDNATAPAYFKTSDAGGTIRDTTGAYFVLPDRRGLSPKHIGDATISGRTKTGPTEVGEMQEDQIQGHWHQLYDFKAGALVGFAGGINRQPDTARSACDQCQNPKTDGVSGITRTGAHTRDSIQGTQFAIVY